MRLTWRVVAWMAAAGVSLAQSPAGTAKAQSPPRWLQAGVELRGRWEGNTGLSYVPGRDDFYYLHRIRAHVTVQAGERLRVFVQAQNSEAPGYGPPAAVSVADRADLHQAYIDFGRGTGKGWNLRAGRQEINFGGQHLVGSANWGNVGRSYDALRLSWETAGLRLDCLASTVVQTRGRRFNRFDAARQLHGIHVSTRDRLARGTLEAYALWKVASGARAESGRQGRQDVFTFGARALGPLRARLDYQLEIAVQRGDNAGDPVAAWAGTGTLGYRPGAGRRSPRLLAGYSFASGDKNPRDNRMGTFDQLYPTNHFYYGIADRISWRNMHESMAGVEIPLPGRWKLTFEHHSFWLASRRDALYSFGGTPVVRNPAAGSSHLDHELDAGATCQLSDRLQLVLGLAHIFPGRYLKESTPGSPATVPYAQWLYRF